jgi:NAD(P)-dependent dehydrogenase (short-subunit alcohol dehydrogenase family)
MEHSIALVTGTTSGLGYAAASLLAAKGHRQVIVTGRSLARVKKRPLNSRLKPRPRSSRRWSWIWTRRPAFSPRSPRSSSEVGRSISYC